MKRPRRSNSSNIHYNLDSGDSDFEARINLEEEEHVSPLPRDHRSSKRKRESFSLQHDGNRGAIRRLRRTSNHIVHDHESSTDRDRRNEVARHRRSSLQTQSRIVRINVKTPLEPELEINTIPATTSHRSNFSPQQHHSQESNASSPELKPSNRLRRLRQGKNVLHESDSDDKSSASRRANNKENDSKNKLSNRHAQLSHRSDEDDYVEESDELDDAEVTTDDSFTSIDDVKDFVVNDDDEVRGHRKRLRRRPATRQSNGRTTRRITRRANSGEDGLTDSGSMVDDLQAELDEIRSPVREIRQRKLRDRTNRPDYAIPPPLTEQMAPIPNETTSRPAATLRNLYPTYANLGLGLRGDGQHTYGNFGPPTGLLSESDSSDEEGQMNRVKGSAVEAFSKSTLPGPDFSSVGSTNLTKAKSSKLADADPVGVDMSIDFDSVGGLSEHVNQLKEMVSLPLLYPEIFERFHITPPRGVLFHGPPGTGKTLMARALAASCSSEGRKISFYMRKGADCLSKWVGEAERQLRLLFEEARNNQPSIIFFDEIDGLAPVRSAKQDQIHASIVSTLLALMDGMDSRGQVVVIGATNRPDSVDPALRRPGRFDREFYFPLPALEARRQILDIHTNKWSPPLDSDFKQQLALQTKGYGGADIRALCTEAALNAVQRKYPQIYVSKDKLIIDPAEIKISAKDFMLAMKKIVPSSARTTSSGAATLPDHLKALLGTTLSSIFTSLNSLVAKPISQNTLEHNLRFIERETTFQEEEMQQILQSLKVYRPTLLISGPDGCGQQHIGRAILHQLEGYHVAMLDIAMLFGDPTSTPESLIVQAFVEAKRHKPSVICLMQLEIWSISATDSMIITLKSLLNSINPHEPILLLGIASIGSRDLSPAIAALFRHPERNLELKPPTEAERKDFFHFLGSVIAQRPSVLHEMQHQEPRVLEDLPLAPPPVPRQISKSERKVIEVKDRKLKLILKAKLNPLLELLKARFKRFKKAAIDEKDICTQTLRDASATLEPLAKMDYERGPDDMILERATGKKFYNTDINLIEERLWSNLYLTPRQFQLDIEHILHDVLQEDSDRERVLRAKEMHTTVLLHLEELFDPPFLQDCKEMAMREIERHRKYAEKQETTQQASAQEAQKTTDITTLGVSSSLNSRSEDGLQPGDISSSDKTSSANTQQDSTMVDVMTLAVDAKETSDLVSDEAAERPPPQSPLKHSGATLAEQIEPPTSTQTSAPHNVSQAFINKANVVNAAVPRVSTEAPGVSTVTQPLESEGGVLAKSSSIKETHVNSYILDERMLENSIQDWARITSGFTVDQLEQLNAAVIDRLWSMRGESNRDKLASVADDVVQQICGRFKAR